MGMVPIETGVPTMTNLVQTVRDYANENNSNPKWAACASMTDKQISAVVLGEKPATTEMGAKRRMSKYLNSLSLNQIEAGQAKYVRDTELAFERHIMG